MCRSGTAYHVRILVFVQTALSLVFTYSDSLRATRSNPVNIVRAMRDILQPWIATPSAMARDDKVGMISILCHPIVCWCNINGSPRH